VDVDLRWLRTGTELTEMRVMVCSFGRLFLETRMKAYMYVHGSAQSPVLEDILLQGTPLLEVIGFVGGQLCSSALNYD